MKDIIECFDEIKIIDGEEIQLKLHSFYDDQLLYYIYSYSYDQIVGYIDLRYTHTKSMYYYGNIGYRINESFRGNGYAYKASLMILDLAKSLEMDYLIITVSPENTPSVKTIEKLPFTYIETVNVPVWHPLFFRERVKRIYRLDLKKQIVNK